MNKGTWLLLSTVFLALLTILGLVGMVNRANASLPAGQAGGSAANKQQSQPQGQYSDDYDSLEPPGLKALSFSTLVNSGKLHVKNSGRPPATFLSNLFAPLLDIAWGNDNRSASGSGEPGVGINQFNPIYALVSGNVSIDSTSDGGNSWAPHNPPNPDGYGDVVNGWLADNPDHALEIALNPSGDGADMTCAQSTDFGVTWTTFASCSTGVRTTFFDDREYIWVDNFPSSPFHGRVYVTEALLDSGGTGSFNTVTVRW